MYTRWLTLSVALVGCAAPPAGALPNDPHPPGHADAGRPSTAPSAAARL